MIQASLIISFFNKIDYLKLVFAGLERQSFREFEIIIADDGSNSQAVEEIEKLTPGLSFSITHLWQEDEGFRKNKILNRAIQQSKSDYLIFIDGDCVPHRKFIEEHFKNKNLNTCLTGRRVNLSKKITDSLTPLSVQKGILEKYFPLITDGIFGDSIDVEKGFYFKNKIIREYFNKKQRGILGCNFSLYKKDILEINGFDERYEAPSIGEDSDIQFRLELLGKKIKSVNNIAVQYHLYHKLQERPQKNLDIFNEVKRSNNPYTPYGITKQPSHHT